MIILALRPSPCIHHTLLASALKGPQICRNTRFLFRHPCFILSPRSDSASHWVIHLHFRRHSIRHPRHCHRHCLNLVYLRLSIFYLLLLSLCICASHSTSHTRYISPTWSYCRNTKHGHPSPPPQPKDAHLGLAISILPITVGPTSAQDPCAPRAPGMDMDSRKGQGCSMFQ